MDIEQGEWNALMRSVGSIETNVKTLVDAKLETRVVALEAAHDEDEEDRKRKARNINRVLAVVAAVGTATSAMAAWAVVLGGSHS